VKKIDINRIVKHKMVEEKRLREIISYSLKGAIKRRLPGRGWG
jgi:hypothetical protein